MVQHIDNLQFERWWKRWLKSADRCYIFSWLNVIEFSKRRILFIWNLRDFYVRLMIDCQLLLSRKCRCHFLFFPRLRQVSVIIQIRCKNSCRKIGFFFKTIFSKNIMLSSWSPFTLKKQQPQYHLHDRTYQKIKKNPTWYTVYVCNLVNVFWNNNNRNMERKKIANMNKEKAYTRNTYVAHYRQMQGLCIQSYNKCICTEDNITIWVYTLIKLFCHLNWLAITKYIKYG